MQENQSAIQKRVVNNQKEEGQDQYLTVVKVIPLINLMSQADLLLAL